jgi:RNA polymerase primary sigma factor
MREKNTINPINQEEIQSYLKDVRKIKVMTPDREKELAVLMKSGNLTEKQQDRVKKELLEGNLRFVISIAKQYQNQGLDLSDLIAEGNLGLLKAIKSFDWNKDLRFISYAVWWVKQSILQSLNDNSRTIRLPVNIVQELQRAKKESNNTGNEIAEKFVKLPLVVNLDTNINDDGDTLLDVIINDDCVMPDANFNSKDVVKNKIKDVLNSLEERERVIIEDYYGLSGVPRTLEDIGEDFGLTKERVRQIKSKSLRKIRNEISDIFDYM